MKTPKVTVITATTGKSHLKNAVESVINQTLDQNEIQHLVFVDGQETSPSVAFAKKFCDVIDLPYSVGKDGYNGHRMYAAGTYFAKGDYIIFLDDDNTFDSDHIQSLLQSINQEYKWAFAFRKITDEEGNLVCFDDCESLGLWPSILHPEDYFVDVNCFCIPKEAAIQLSPIWYRKIRQPGVPEVDRLLTHYMRQLYPKYTSNFKYSVNYKAGNNDLSVRAEFFTKGNESMLKKYNGDILPWKQLM